MQQLELANELEFDPLDTVEWGRKWLVDFNAGIDYLILTGLGLLQYLYC